MADSPCTNRTSPDYWDQRYAGRDYAFGTAPNAWLASQAHRLRPGMTALVPGDGEGRNGVWLAEQGLEVLSIDWSQAGLAKARRLAEQRGVDLKLRQADLLAWDWPAEEFDLVASIFLHFDPPVRRQMHRRMLASLRPGGLLIIQGFHQSRPHPTGRSGDAARYLTADLLREDFDAAEVLELAEAEVELQEGPAHTGRFPVVQGVVRRATHALK